jgi:hypothetical protein
MPIDKLDYDVFLVGLQACPEMTASGIPVFTRNGNRLW